MPSTIAEVACSVQRAAYSLQLTAHICIHLHPYVCDYPLLVLGSCEGVFVVMIVRWLARNMQAKVRYTDGVYCESKSCTMDCVLEG